MYGARYICKLQRHSKIKKIKMSIWHEFSALIMKLTENINMLSYNWDILRMDLLRKLIVINTLVMTCRLSKYFHI